ncbi:unnamed protein product [Rotaria sp. Silwood2]|nr:unnamed protein product [Rotaria sp. Silwood2]CAF4049588.1 unnamed protein product [Rotaria sp. Silwood2]
MQEKNDPKQQWCKIVNPDFSEIFTIEGFQNSKNDIVYAEDPSEISAQLRETQKVKYPSGVILWDAICTNGLIPNDD